MKRHLAGLDGGQLLLVKERQVEDVLVRLPARPASGTAASAAAQTARGIKSHALRVCCEGYCITSTACTSRKPCCLITACKIAAASADVCKHGLRVKFCLGILRIAASHAGA